MTLINGHRPTSTKDPYPASFRSEHSLPDDLIDVTVVGGAGHVGIPLVLCFADSGMRVLINDQNEGALTELSKGRLPFIEYEAQPVLDRVLSRKALRYGSKPSEIGRNGPVIITIGTPVDEFLNPELGPVKKCIDELLPFVDDGQLIVLRSTLYPGTTDWLHRYLEDLGRKLLVAYCPERVVQGFGIVELRGLPQIVSGTSKEAEDKAAKLFARIAPEIVRVTALEAEFAKIFTNVYRYVEFAATNQFYMIAQSAGADYSAILRAMKHNYPRAARIPGPGFSAGPCLFKDTMQLAAFSGNKFALGSAAMLANEGLVLHVVDHLRQTYDLSRATVGLLGMAFKPEIDDTRSSLSYKLRKSLLLYSRKVITTDPFVKNDPNLLPVEDVIEHSDILIMCTPHRFYKTLDLRGKPIFDVWDFVRTQNDH
jgi:UDP-N-acetyl-D-mannosaminuronic acid dehydrogenase